ncbi:MAG: hypothetical protein Q9227_006718 [Pyrenula ochraceoflavens]
MGRERQKRKNRSSISKVKPKTPGRTKSGKKKVNILGNAIIAENWDKNLTLSQNYRRLGLTSKLNAPTGGLEKTSLLKQMPNLDALAIKPNSQQINGLVEPKTTRVERDPATGAIIRLIENENAQSESDSASSADKTSAAYKIRQKRHRLDDALDRALPPQQNGIRAQGVDGYSVIPSLEAEAQKEAQSISKRRRPRQQSDREREWLCRLVKKHGDNVAAMARDMKLNPMQQTEADIRKRLEKFSG